MTTKYMDLKNNLNDPGIFQDKKWLQYCVVSDALEIK